MKPRVPVNEIVKVKNQGAKKALQEACQATLNDARHALQDAVYLPNFQNKIAAAKKGLQRAERLYAAWKEFS